MHSLLLWDYGDVGERLGSPEEVGSSAFLETSAEVLHVHWCLWFHSLQFILLYSHDEKNETKNEASSTQSQLVCLPFV